MKNTITNMGFMVRPTCAGQLTSDFTTTDSFSNDSLPQQISIKNLSTDSTIKTTYNWNAGKFTSSDYCNPAVYFEDNKTKNLIPFTNSNGSSKDAYKLQGTFSRVDNLNVRLNKVFEVSYRNIEKNVIVRLAPSLPNFLYSKTSVPKIVLRVLFKNTVRPSAK